MYVPRWVKMSVRLGSPSPSISWVFGHKSWIHEIASMLLVLYSSLWFAFMYFFSHHEPVMWKCKMVGDLLTLWVRVMYFFLPPWNEYVKMHTVINLLTLYVSSSCTFFRPSWVEYMKMHRSIWIGFIQGRREHGTSGAPT